MKRAWPLVAAVVVVGVVFLAVFPTRTYLDQRRELTAAERRARVLAAQNQELEAKVQRLNTDAEIERLARKDYNLVRPGEEPFAILPSASPPPAPVGTPAPAAVKAEPEPPWWRRALTRLTDVF